MNKILTRLIIILLITVATTWIAYDVIIRSGMRYFSAFRKNNEMFRTHTAYDLLLLGSSRMKNTVNTAILDSLLHINSFNAGQAGANLVEIKMILDAYLGNHPPPKFIVISLDVFSLNTFPRLGFSPIYLPYIDIPQVNKIVKENGINTALYKMFPFLLSIEMDDYYKSAVLKLISHHNEFAIGDFYYKGYESNGLNTIETEPPPSSILMPVNEEGKKILLSVISNCKKQNIKLLLTYAPEYKFKNEKNIINLKEIMNFYKAAADANNIPFLRNDSLPMCQERNLFANAGHVNRKGAEIYSAILAKQLFLYGITNDHAKEE